MPTLSFHLACYPTLFVGELICDFVQLPLLREVFEESSLMGITVYVREGNIKTGKSCTIIIIINYINNYY